MWKPGCALKGGLIGVKRKIVVFGEALACVTPDAFSPHSVGLTLRWRVTVEQRSYEGWCGGALAVGGSDENVVSVVALIDNRWSSL